MLRSVWERMLLEGEPDGGSAGAATSPADPAPGAASSDAPVEPGQQPAADPASAPAAEGASEGSPAPDAPEAPAEGTEAAPAEDGLSDADWEALWEKYPERDPRTAAEKAKADARKELEQQPERVRRADPFYQALTAASQESYGRIARSSQQMLQGELPEDVGAFLADVDTNSAWAAASERRGHIAVGRAVTERVLGIDPAKLDDGDPLQKQYGDLLTGLETAQQNAYRMRGQAVREYDPQKRADILTRAETMDAFAVGDFYRQAVELIHEHGKSVGAREAEKSASKRITDATKQARTNGHTEAIARARATVAGGTAMATAAQPGQPKNIDNTDEARQQRLAYGRDKDGNRPTDDDRKWLSERYPDRR